MRLWNSLLDRDIHDCSGSLLVRETDYNCSLARATVGISAMHNAMVIDQGNVAVLPHDRDRKLSGDARQSC